MLVRELSAKAPFDRAFAARNLLLLGEPAKAARALADEDAYVRVNAACAALSNTVISCARCRWCATTLPAMPLPMMAIFMTRAR